LKKYEKEKEGSTRRKSYFYNVVITTVFKKGGAPWNKGKSADPDSPNYDPRVAKYGKSQSKTKLELFDKGELIIWSKGHTKDSHPSLKSTSDKLTGRISPLRGVPRPDDVKRKIHNSLIGRKHTDEHRLNNSKAQRDWHATHKHPNKGKPMTQDQKNKMGRTRKERIKTGDIKSMRGYKHTNIAKKHMSESAILRKGKYPKTNTSIEVILQNALTELDIPFKTDEPILKISRTDIFISPNICIYADGDYWHTLPGKKEKDNSINRILTEYGYKVFRFWGSEIRDNPTQCVTKILEYIKK